MTKNEKEINVLDELNKGACMGRDAINYIMDKVSDSNLRDELNKQYREYQEILDRIGNLYPEYSDKEPHETGVITKAMTWYGIEVKTLLDKSTSKIAELLVEGTNMGIVEGRRLLNHKNTEKEVEEIIKEYVTIQEKAVEKLKKYL